TRKVSIDEEGIHYSSLFAKKTIALDEIDETSFTESDDEADSFEVVGANGVSINVSSWLNDFSGFKHLVGTIAAEQAG
ncbi:MAG: hypothetical protein HQL32_17975, partial [Planctomycetes bacterium]|nr:hypothetical protein [Planctomycetota bacterium]